jgi:hypothetical protein
MTNEDIRKAERAYRSFTEPKRSILMRRESYCPRCGAKAPYHTDNCGPWIDGKTSDAPKQPKP